MTTQVITIDPKMLIDIEGMEIPVSTNRSFQASINKEVSVTGNNFSSIRTGRFRKIFNRHSIIFH